MRTKLIFFSILLLFTSMARAQNQGTIAGTIEDAVNHEPIHKANILLLGTHWGAASDNQGQFKIWSLIHI